MAASSSTTSFVVVESFSTSESSTSSEHDGRVVRFDSECILIPEYSAQRRHRVVTKSYSLPLWKRRGAGSTAASDSEGTDDPSSSTGASLPSNSPEETHVVIRVPIPRLVRRASPSPGPSRRVSGRSPSASPTIPLSPCLVQRTTSSSPLESRSPPFLHSPIRRVSQPIYHRRQDDQTIPLRACCPDCVPITEQCLREGSTWQEKFTKGARRRRSASLDSGPSNGGTLVAGGIHSTTFTPGSFDARMPAPTFALTVDEVDRRRRSQDFGTASVDIDVQSEGGRSRSPLGRSTTFDPDHSADSLLSDTSSPDLSSPYIQSHLISQRKASPIAEEDESELFPLPSPRRSPTGSTGSSPRNSPRMSPGLSPTPSPGPSPNSSSSCLHPDSAVVLATALREKAKTRSKESISSEELLLSNGISRKSSDVGTPPQSGASTPRAGKPRLPSLAVTFPTMRQLSVNSDPGYSSNRSGGIDIKLDSPILPCAGLSSSLTSISSTSSTPKSPVTPSSPKVMPSSKMNRKLSFGLPFIRASEAIKGAGADVLRGVTSMSGGGLHIGRV